MSQLLACSLTPPPPIFVKFVIHFSSPPPPMCWPDWPLPLRHIKVRELLSFLPWDWIKLQKVTLSVAEWTPSLCIRPLQWKCGVCSGVTRLEQELIASVPLNLLRRTRGVWVGAELGLTLFLLLLPLREVFLPNGSLFLFVYLDWFIY